MPRRSSEILADAKVRETIATGYTYQGQLLRPALVFLQSPASEPAVNEAAAPAAAVNGKVKEVHAIEEQTLL
ncbi:MAG TPA: hypothetical protein VFB72_00385 [Verrucomicrobiae bacterium]|nr:hypothetical protein [Verrucomicrobiae bacterium]